VQQWLLVITIVNEHLQYKLLARIRVHCTTIRFEARLCLAEIFLSFFELAADGLLAILYKLARTAHGKPGRAGCIEMGYRFYFHFQMRYGRSSTAGQCSVK